MKLIVGLGNPGKEYENTRHNIGFMVLGDYANKKNLIFSKLKDGGLYIKTCIENEEVILLKPQKYINLSGEVVIKFVKYYKINIDDILIINDDLDIELGKYKFEYKRLKIGISNNKNIEAKDYVLGKLSSDEKLKLQTVINISSEIIDDYLHINFDKLMNKYNK